MSKNTRQFRCPAQESDPSAFLPRLVSKAARRALRLLGIPPQGSSPRRERETLNSSLISPFYKQI